MRLTHNGSEEPEEPDQDPKPRHTARSLRVLLLSTIDTVIETVPDL